MRDPYRSVRIILAASAAVIGFGLTSSADDIDNPYKVAKIGDFVKYKSICDTDGKSSVSYSTQTITARTNKEVTVLTEIEYEGVNQKIPGKELKIPLDKPYDPAMITSEGRPAEVENLGEGEETIRIGEKEYKCHWTKSRISYFNGGVDYVSIVKMATCKDVPLNGVVKLETETELQIGGKTVKTRILMELMDFRKNP